MVAVADKKILQTAKSRTFLPCGCTTQQAAKLEPYLLACI